MTRKHSFTKKTLTVAAILALSTASPAVANVRPAGAIKETEALEILKELSVSGRLVDQRGSYEMACVCCEGS